MYQHSAMEDSYLTIILAAAMSTAALFFLKRLMNRLRGKAGEKVVSAKLGRLPKDKYVVLDDIILPTPRGTSQIDQLVISVYGIFVIETKNCSGLIYGNANAEYWTQNIYGNKNRLYNPIFQNAGHIRALERVLRDFGPLPFFPVIAFSERAEIKVRTKDAALIYWNQLPDEIGRHRTEFLSPGQVKEICDTILAARLEPGRATERQHIKNVRRIKEQKQ